MRKFLFILVLFIATRSFEQNLQNANWCFGTHARLNFNSAPPTSMYSSLDFETTSDIASVSDDNGVLLFYSNGKTVWGKDGNPMPNGLQLYASSGNTEAHQCLAIVPKPNQAGIYYLFTGSSGSDNNPPSGHTGIYYSVINMNLNSGNGDVVTGLKNIPLKDHNAVPIDYDANTGSGLKVENVKVTTTLNNAGDKVWVMFYLHFNAGGIENRYVYGYQVSENGINNLADGTSPQPYPTAITLVDNANYPGVLADDWFGSIKISPNGAYLCDATPMVVNLFNFSNQTGAVTFNRTVYIGIPDVTNSGYGLEFSPNSQFIYFSIVNNKINQDGRSGKGLDNPYLCLYQNGINSDTNVLIGKFQIPSNSFSPQSINPIPANNPYGLQRAINNKVYVCVADFSGGPVNGWLGAVEQPDLAYPACNFNQYEVQLLTGSLHWGSLPQWVHRAQPTGLWIWMKGDNTTNQPSVYGTQGVPSSNNKPGYRTGSSTWTDLSGNLWLFGGNRSYHDANGLELNERFNDLWKYDVLTNQWTWVNGDNIPDQPGVYGTKGAPSPTNKPGARTSAAAWVDGSGHLWMFGGGHTTQGFYYFNDLWEYDISSNQWTWAGGDNIANQVGAYGTQGVPSFANKPGGRENAKAWADASGNFWIWGGAGIAYSNNSYTSLNDLWKYNSGQWTWMKGGNFSVANTQPLAFFGFRGFESSLNTPAGQSFPGVSWTDINGNFWLFGGMTYIGGTQLYGYSNALWKYNINTNNWVWVNGDNTSDQTGVYGTQGVPALANKPGARNSLVSWTDPSHNFWLYGGNAVTQYPSGIVASDLWKYDVSSGMWTWVSGPAVPFSSTVSYGTQGIGTTTTTPGQREYSVSWTGNSGDFWLFGGLSGDFRNDLWKYTGNCSGPNCRPVSSKGTDMIVKENVQGQPVVLQKKKEERPGELNIRLLEIYNTAGQLVKRVNNSSEVYEVLKNNRVEGLSAGLYFIWLIYKDNHFESLKRYLQ